MDIPSQAQLVEQIDAFLRRSGMAVSRFGREITGESNFVATVRGGREPNRGTLQKIADFIARHDEEAEGKNGSIGRELTEPERDKHRLSAGAR